MSTVVEHNQDVSIRFHECSQCYTVLLSCLEIYFSQKRATQVKANFDPDLAMTTQTHVTLPEVQRFRSLRPGSFMIRSNFVVCSNYNLFELVNDANLNSCCLQCVISLFN